MVKLEEIECTFETYINSFYYAAPSEGSHRYKSWEYCYKFFCDNKDRLKEDPIVDLAALHLAFYLASWGMYRGSSFILQTDYTVHKGAVEHISKYFELTKINIDYWRKQHTCKLFELVDKLKKHYADEKKDGNENVSDTLITKILLGTLGITPAYDSYFKNGVGLYNYAFKEDEKHKHIPATFSEEGFNKLIAFCKNNHKILDKIECTLKIGGELKYPLMKKIDMYFWNLGRPWAKKDDTNDKWMLINGNKPVNDGNKYINYLPKGDNIELNCYEKYISKNISLNTKKG